MGPVGRTLAGTAERFIFRHRSISNLFCQVSCKFDSTTNTRVHSYGKSIQEFIQFWLDWGSGLGWVCRNGGWRSLPWFLHLGHWYAYIQQIYKAIFTAVASAIVGIVQITTHESWSGYILLGAFAVGFGLFFVLNQMLMICCVSPMVRVHTASSEQVHIVSGSAPVPAAAGAYGAYQPTSQVPYHVGDPGLPPQTNEALYPYIDEPTKDYPPSYSEAIRDSYPQKQPSAPAL